jgi:prolipoprotein diacylglyceryltransferase
MSKNYSRIRVRSPRGFLLRILSPDRWVWYLGPVPIRAYALCIAAIIVAILGGARRWRARGTKPGR